MDLLKKLNPSQQEAVLHGAGPLLILAGAAAVMVRGGFRHLVVVEGHEVVGLLSMRDIVRCWSAARIPVQAGAPDTAQVPRPA